ncbi:50S ribosomal protein L18 [Candidatus Gracilibacteria bacterium]|nr:50S ribosomal protein L18 [Candidatus Gracilibacteria bacterium]
MKRKNTVNKKGLLKNRLKSKVQGTADKLRFCLSRSNTSLYGQLINDVEGKTVFGFKVKKGDKGIEEMGKVFGEKFKGQKIAFDRNGNLYHGVVKKCADALRKGGLDF